ncbi:lysosomal-trafficking regulator [Caerostris extrusa]|uniref:Lysosomal-trafficking regulator n=1 Tax=Caerostris extrusa TaxID=172846 RepID=A0AAV4XD71_CAEEX|nr:lysosomal-trafficking regulator [Caerostris extrusa]
MHMENRNLNLSIKEFIHHHNDIFGPSANYIDSSKEPVCCIGSMSCMLLKIFNLPVSKCILIEVIKQVKMCGICCCLNPGFILKILLSRFNDFDYETQHLTLLLLEKYLFPQFGLSLKKHNLCAYCSMRLSESENLSWPLFERLNESYHQDKKEMLGRNLNAVSTFWSNFNIYSDLLNSCAVETLENVAKHLTQIFAGGANELKRQMFIRVILPQFLQLSTFDNSLSGNSSNEVLDGITSSDKEATDVGSYGESYAGDTEGSNSMYFYRLLMLCTSVLENILSGLLLKCLNVLVDNVVIQPIWSTNFPCLQKPTALIRRLKKRLKAVYNIYNQFSSSNSKTCAWTCSALYFPLTEDTRWNSFNQGFSFTLWMKINHLDHLCPFLLSESNKNYVLLKRRISGDDNKDLFEKDTDMLHIASVGSHKFLLELWYDGCEKDLVIRIINCNNGEITCLSKGVYKSILETNDWHHLALNYSEESNKSVISCRVQIILNGTKENVFNLTFKRPGSNLLNTCYVLLGHSESNVEDFISSSYSIGSFMFFKGDILTRDVIFYLSSCGPNLTNITDCAVQKRNSFIPKHNYCQNVTALISFDVLMGFKVPSLESLQKLPLKLQALSTGQVSCSKIPDFQYAFQRAGGITLFFLFLFAYVLEHGSHQEDLPVSLI